MPGPLEINSVAVVMPAHNEDQHIGKALVALKAAADALQRDCPDVEARMVVVLDHCTDRSAEIAAAHASGDNRFSVVNVNLRSTGASRDYGFRAALESLRARDTAGIWLATTDADSAVPRALADAASGTGQRRSGRHPWLRGTRSRGHGPGHPSSLDGTPSVPGGPPAHLRRQLGNPGLGIYQCGRLPRAALP